MLGAMAGCMFHDASAATIDRQVFELVESAFSRREKVVIFVQNDQRAAAIDRTLWIMKQEAFIPHRIFGSGDNDPDVPVAIVTGEWNPVSAGVLIAEGHCSLDFACGFETIHEFVNRSSPEIHQACRDRYRDYRQRQVPVEYSK